VRKLAGGGLFHDAGGGLFFFIYTGASTFRLAAKFLAIPEGLRSTLQCNVVRSKYFQRSLQTYYVRSNLLLLRQEVPNESEGLKGTLCFAPFAPPTVSASFRLSLKSAKLLWK
jgi:hypothetical protein